MNDSSARQMGVVRTALVFGGIASLLVIGFMLVHLAALALLLAFAGVLVGSSLRGVAEWLAAKFHCRVGWALLGCVGAFAVFCALRLLWIVPRIDAHVATLTDQLMQAYDDVRARLAQTAIGSKLDPGALALDKPLQYVSRAAGVLASVVGAIGAAVIVGFVALHVATDPDVYRRGILRLVHLRDARGPARSSAHSRGRCAAGCSAGSSRMTVVGIATTIGLMMLGVPLPVTLGLLAGALGFIPNIGPLASAIPALLLAATVDLAHVVYTSALYIGINIVDGYVLTPLIEKRAVATPAALVIISQLVFGALWGIVGIMLATPLLACALVLIRMLYVEDVVERSTWLPRPRRSTSSAATHAAIAQVAKTTIRKTYTALAMAFAEPLRRRPRPHVTIAAYAREARMARTNVDHMDEPGAQIAPRNADAVGVAGDRRIAFACRAASGIASGTMAKKPVAAARQYAHRRRCRRIMSSR